MGSAECALHALLLNPRRAVYRLRSLLREFIPCEVSWRADFNRLAAQDGRFHSKSGLVFAGAIFHGFSVSGVRTQAPGRKGVKDVSNKKLDRKSTRLNYS